MGEINIIKVDGKPLEKLIDVISKGIGTIYRPRAIRKEADAKAYEIEVIERAKSKALAEGKEIDAETYDRIQERIIFKETKRQKNIDYVSKVAAEQLEQEQTVSEDPVDEDWISRFFNIVEDVSDEEMQQLWGRILAGEVKQPKTYSLRTLELLKNLSRREAEVFSRVANFVISSYNSPFLFKGKSIETPNTNSITLEDRLLLTETGILQAENTIFRKLGVSPSDSLVYFESGRYIIKGLKKANSPEVGIEIWRFTKIGEELLNLLLPNPHEDYIKEFCKRLEELGLEVEYAHIIVKHSDGTISHTMPWINFKTE